MLDIEHLKKLASNEDEILMKVLNKFFEGEMDKYTLDILNK